MTNASLFKRTTVAMTLSVRIYLAPTCVSVDRDTREKKIVASVLVKISLDNIAILIRRQNDESLRVRAHIPIEYL